MEQQQKRIIIDNFSNKEFIKINMIKESILFSLKQTII